MSPEQNLARSVIATALQELSEYPKRLEDIESKDAALFRGKGYKEEVKKRLLSDWIRAREFFTLSYSNFWFEAAELDKSCILRYNAKKEKP